MARKFDFTRTVTATIATALCFNKETAEAENKTVALSGTYPDGSKKLFKLVSKELSNDTIKVIEIVDVEHVSKLYGITVDDFMKNATELDPKTRQPIKY